MTQKQWNLVRDMSEVHQTQVFSGGACNILNEQGELLRNTERDTINDWLTEQGIKFFDPQIHPDTHGCEYDYHVHHGLEMAARVAAKVNLYEVSPRTFSGITGFEIAIDHFQWHEPTVIYYSDGFPEKDDLPAHSEKGHPLFMPDGIRESEKAMQAHYREFLKNGNNMRKYIMTFAREMETLTATFSNHPRRNDIVIDPDRMHAVDLLRAVVRANSNERVFVTFTGDADSRDERGNPKFILPDSPLEVETMALLDQYVDEGNELRRSIAELMEVSVFLRVVYTQKAAIQALSEMLHLIGLM